MGRIKSKEELMERLKCSTTNASSLAAGAGGKVKRVLLLPPHPERTGEGELHIKYGKG